MRDEATVKTVDVTVVTALTVAIVDVPTVRIGWAIWIACELFELLGRLGRFAWHLNDAQTVLAAGAHLFGRVDAFAAGALAHG